MKPDSVVRTWNLTKYRLVQTAEKEHLLEAAITDALGDPGWIVKARLSADVPSIASILLAGLVKAAP